MVDWRHHYDKSFTALIACTDRHQWLAGGITMTQGLHFTASVHACTDRFRQAAAAALQVLVMSESA